VVILTKEEGENSQMRNKKWKMRNEKMTLT